MKFLFHSENAVYNETTKVWTFTLDERFHNPTEIEFENVIFSPAGTSKPNCVFMRSNSMKNMISEKHTMLVKSHQEDSNVIAVLHEQHDGRYRIQQPRTFAVNPNRSSRIIDFYFTDGETKIAEEETSTNNNTTPGSNEQVIIDLNTAGKLVLWLPMTFGTLLDVSNIPVADTDFTENVRYITNKLTDAPQNIIMGTNKNFTRVVLGASDNFGITGADQSWSYAADTSNNTNFPDGSSFVWSCIIKTPATMGWSYMLNTQRGLIIAVDSGNAVMFQQEGNSWATLSTLNWFPNRDYILTVKRKEVNGTKNLYWTMEDLLLDSIKTETSADCRSFQYNATEWDITFGWSSTGSKFQHGVSLWSIVDDSEADAVETAFHAYCKEKYTGVVASSENSSSTTTVKSTFLVDCNINVK